MRRVRAESDSKLDAAHLRRAKRMLVLRRRPRGTLPRLEGIVCDQPCQTNLPLNRLTFHNPQVTVGGDIGEHVYPRAGERPLDLKPVHFGGSAETEHHAWIM